MIVHLLYQFTLKCYIWCCWDFFIVIDKLCQLLAIQNIWSVYFKHFKLFLICHLNQSRFLNLWLFFRQAINTQGWGGMRNRKAMRSRRNCGWNQLFLQEDREGHQDKKNSDGECWIIFEFGHLKYAWMDGIIISDSKNNKIIKDNKNI